MTEYKRKALVLGGAGFIGHHMARYLKEKGYWVRTVDIQPQKYPDCCDEFIQGDLQDTAFVEKVIQFRGYDHNFYEFTPSKYLQPFDEIYQFACNMGGAGYIFSGDNDADVMHSSAMINLNVIESVRQFNDFTGKNITKIFYSSSACMYPEHNQLDPDNPDCREDSAYPAAPDSEYGWEKLFSERLYFAYNRNYDIPVRVARYHNIFGPEGTWDGGKEKAPAAICRKVCLSDRTNGEVEIWGDGKQTRSFLYISECVEATYRLVQSNFMGPVNIGSEEMVSINQLVDIACKVANKKVVKHHVPGPLGVRGRNSNNDLIREKLGWDYEMSLEEGIGNTYNWIQEQLFSRDEQ